MKHLSKTIMIKKQLYALLLFIYFSASYIGATHIHHDSEEDYPDDCQVCVINSNLHSGDIPLDNTSTSTVEVLFEAPYFKTLSYVFSLILPYQAQAPPHIFFT